MQIRSFDDIVKMQQEFSVRLAARLAEPAATTLEQLMDEKRAQLERSVAALDELKRKRHEVMARLESELDRNYRTILRLEREINEFNETKREHETLELHQPERQEKTPKAPRSKVRRPAPNKSAKSKRTPSK